MASEELVQHGAKAVEIRARCYPGSRRLFGGQIAHRAGKYAGPKQTRATRGDIETEVADPCRTAGSKPDRTRPQVLMHDPLAVDKFQTRAEIHPDAKRALQ